MPPASLVSGLWPQLAPIIFLGCSNVFMTIAWYGHLKFKSIPLVTVVLVSWGIAFVEYCFAVPANRIGSAVYSPAELKTIQEVISLIVFAGFTAVYFKEPLSLTQSAGFALIALGAAGVSRAGLTGAATTEPPDGLPPTGGRRLRSDASEQVADRQDDVGYDGDPEGVAADEWDCHERSDDGQNGQHHRDDEHRGGWR
jgi:uncharacterized protein (DUF486 family)